MKQTENNNWSPIPERLSIKAFDSWEAAMRFLLKKDCSANNGKNSSALCGSK